MEKERREKEKNKKEKERREEEENPGFELLFGTLVWNCLEISYVRFGNYMCMDYIWKSLFV